jgi:hypothetical protein
LSPAKDVETYSRSQTAHENLEKPKEDAGARTLGVRIKTMPKRPSIQKGKITKAEADWKEKWPVGYLYVAPDHEPGTHDAEKGDVTWHTMFLRPEKDRGKIRE